MMEPSSTAFGLLWPCDGRNDREFWNWLPERVSLLVARYEVGGGLDCDQLSADSGIEVLVEASRLLRHARPSVIGLGDFGAGAVSGIEEELKKVRAIEGAAGVPVVSMCLAWIDAIRAAGASRVSLISPYGPGVTQATETILADSGIEVLASGSLGCTTEEGIGTMSFEEWRHIVAATVRPGAGAVAVAGGGTSLFHVINGLQDVAGKPVITGPGSLIKSMLSRLGNGVAGPIHEDSAVRGGLGCVATGAEVRALLSSATKVHALADSPPTMAGGRGSTLRDAGGGEFLDFACGSGSTGVGHGNARILGAVRNQLASGLTHVGLHFASTSQVRLYGMLRQLLPEGLSRFHPATNGTEAVETALKAAMHYTGRRRFLAFRGGYHGRTLGALAVSESRGHNSGLGTLLPETHFVEFGCPHGDLEQALDRGGPFAGIVVEPIQATNGIVVPPKGWLKEVSELAAGRAVPLIADEVFTGCGRTGTFFAFEAEGFVPDLLVLAKGFGGGFPAGPVAGRDDIMTGWLPGTQSSTFQLHPVSASASQAALECIISDDLTAAAPRIFRKVQEHGSGLTEFPFVGENRGAGHDRRGNHRRAPGTGRRTVQANQGGCTVARTRNLGMRIGRARDRTHSTAHDFGCGDHSRNGHADITVQVCGAGRMARLNAVSAGRCRWDMCPADAFLKALG